jgi:hypothetical protein
MTFEKYFSKAIYESKIRVLGCWKKKKRGGERGGEKIKILFIGINWAYKLFNGIA